MNAIEKKEDSLFFKTYPPFSLALSPYTVERTKQACLIQPSIDYRGVDSLVFDQFTYFVEQTLLSFLPKALIDVLSRNLPIDQIEREMHPFMQQLPLLKWNDPEVAPCTICATFLGPAEFTHGVGRYISDTLTKWLIPGNRLNISSVQSLSFRFIAYEKRGFFFQQIFLDIKTNADLAITRNINKTLSNEIRTNTLAVKHARQLVTKKKLSFKQRQIVAASLASLLKESSKNTTFDKMHHLLFCLEEEERLQSFKNHASLPLEKDSKFYDRDIFEEIKHFVLLFGENFVSRHHSRYVRRLISYLHLFKKSLQHGFAAPNMRLLHLKLLKCDLIRPIEDGGHKPILGLLGALNDLRENERFEERHIMHALNHCIQNVRCVKHSFVLDRNFSDAIMLFYIELEKIDETAFTASEIKQLHTNLPHEIKASIESVIHPIFMPRNEEEIMRNILLLNQQLKYVSDLPQVIISFDMQTQHEIFFTITLLRAVKNHTPSVTSLFEKMESFISLKGIEVKKVGLLRNRYVKEANVLKVALKKKIFLRRDFSIDLFKARRALSEALENAFEGIRDFNGGILLKQQEVFTELCELIDEKDRDSFFLENFFYSLIPTVKQSLLPSPTLKSLFYLMQKTLTTTRTSGKSCIAKVRENKELFLVVCTASNGLKNQLLALQQRGDTELVSTYVYAYGIHCIGFIHQHADPKERNRFWKIIHAIYSTKK